MKDTSDVSHSSLMPLTLSAPGKTFLVGEYVALDGGPSILVSTAPRFELVVSKKSNSHRSDQTPNQSSFVIAPDAAPFAAGSPAGKYYARHREALAGFNFQFNDPHKIGAGPAKGGLGASSAQFALMLAFHRGLKPEVFGSTSAASSSSSPGSVEAASWASILSEYRECAWDGQGIPPSGADVVSQLNGGFTWFDGRAQKSESLTWGFDDLAFTLIRTGQKLATHEHLKENAPAPHASLRTVVREGLKAFESADEQRLIEAVNACAHVLRDAGLTASHSLSLLDQMRAEPALFYAAKGCGAMGADLILVLHAVKNKAAVAAWAQARGLEVGGDSSTVTDGLVVTHDATQDALTRVAAH